MQRLMCYASPMGMRCQRILTRTPCMMSFELKMWFACCAVGSKRTNERTHDQSYGMTKTNKTVRFVHKWVRACVRDTHRYFRARNYRSFTKTSSLSLGIQDNVRNAVVSACLSIDLCTA